MAYKHGSFVWFELITSDIAAAKTFYPETVGWTTSEMDMGDFKYTMLNKGDAPQAGLVNPPKDMSGVPNHWSSYLSVDDVDAKTAKVREHDGKVLVPPSDIPGVGRFSLVADPQGATFRLFKGQNSDDNGSTAFHWNELWAKDASAVLPFYQEVFGYTVETMNMPTGPYHVLKLGDTAYGGVMTAPKAEVPPMWLPYISVDDCDAAVERAKRLGAKVQAEAINVDNVGRFAIVTDNAGAAIGLITPAAR